MKKERLLLLVFLIFLCSVGVTGCKKKNKSSDEIVTYLKNLKSYESNIEMYVNNDKQELKYVMKQYCDASMGYRLDIGENRIQVYKNNKIYVTDKGKDTKYELSAEFDELYKISFIGEYIKILYTNDEVKYDIKEIDGKSYQLIYTALPGNNKNLDSAIMYVDIERCVPTKITIYDSRNKERVNILFSEFKSNINLSKELFEIKES
jgi:outer membrane lipoprotein-sorting protein